MSKLSTTTDEGKTHRYRYINTVPFNRTGFVINFLEYWEINKNGVIKHFSWVTDIKVTVRYSWVITVLSKCNCF